MLQNTQSKRFGHKFVSYFVIVVLSVLLLFAGNRIATQNLSLFSDEYAQEVVKAVVTNVGEKVTDTYSVEENSSITSVSIDFQATILSGPRKGETVSAVQTIDSFTIANTTEVEEGNKILLIAALDEVHDWYFMEFLRSDLLLILGAAFILALLVFGRLKGFNTVLSLGLTCAAIIAVFIPAILSGKNIYLWSLLVCVYCVLMTLFIVNGISKKTFAAIIGCLAGIAVTGLLTHYMSKLLALTGVLDEESVYLTYLPTETPIDLRAIIFAAIVIGAMGAIMDVAMSISSSLWEVKEESSSPTFRNLFRSGMNIGRDVMGTMANTLILAYIGSSLSVVLLLSVYSSSMLGLFNREMIVVEILQSLIGSFGLLFTMPFTSAISASLYARRMRAFEIE